MVRNEPRAERGVTGAPSTSQRVIDRRALGDPYLVHDAVTSERQNKAIDQLGMPDRQPLRVPATAREAHDPDPSPPLLADHRGVVVRDVSRATPGCQVGAPADVDDREVVTVDRVEPRAP